MHIFNLLLTNNFSGQKVGLPKRNTGDWYHSIAVLSTVDPEKFVRGETYPCFVFDYTSNGVSFTQQSLKVVYENTVFEIDEKFGILAKVPSLERYVSVKNVSFFTLQKLWNTIEYSHGFQQAFNCLGFTDDLIYFAEHGKRNPRILKVHEKFDTPK